MSFSFQLTPGDLLSRRLRSEEREPVPMTIRRFYPERPRRIDKRSRKVGSDPGYLNINC